MVEEPGIPPSTAVLANLVNTGVAVSALLVATMLIGMVSVV